MIEALDPDLRAARHRARISRAVLYQQALALRDKAECARIVAEHQAESSLDSRGFSDLPCERKGVSIVTGDTKVVERGKADGLYVNTAGVGVPVSEREIAPRSLRAGDVVLVSGDVGRHGMAIMAARGFVERYRGLQLPGSDAAVRCDAWLAGQPAGAAEPHPEPHSCEAAEQAIESLEADLLEARAEVARLEGLRARSKAFLEWFYEAGIANDDGRALLADLRAGRAS